MTDQKFLKPIPVILDTDIGWDIDDTWALITLLNSPELDLRMVLTSTGNTRCAPNWWQNYWKWPAGPISPLGLDCIRMIISTCRMIGWMDTVFALPGQDIC